MAAIFGYAEPLRILCTREFQNSIKESFHAEIKTSIARYSWLQDAYDVGENYIRGLNGTEFLFKGLRRSMSAIRSTHGVDICIIEEAEDVPESAYRELIPTIRAPGSEVWMIWNPLMRGSATDNRFRVNPPDNAAIASLNYNGNPWFPEVLEDERQRDMELLDGNTYAHIWDGAYLDNSDRQVLGGKWRVEEFEPEPEDGWDGPYHGLDFGFSQDPTAGVKCWIFDDRLWVEREAVKTGLELDDTFNFLADKIPGIADYDVPADSARPESISYLSRHGLARVKPVKKWSGSIVDGIQHLRSYKEIIIHPRCEHARNEARLYSHKVDRISGQVMPDIVDTHNHVIDAIRYALGDIIRKRNPSIPLFGTQSGQA
jgi:phage terminase large subunit